MESGTGQGVVISGVTIAVGVIFNLVAKQLGVDPNTVAIATASYGFGAGLGLSTSGTLDDVVRDICDLVKTGVSKLTGKQSTNELRDVFGK